MKYYLLALIILIFLSCKEEINKSNDYNKNELKTHKNTNGDNYKKSPEYIQAFEEFNNKKLKSAYNQFIELVKKYPNDIELNYHIGFIAAKSNNLPIAEKFLTKTVELDKSKWQAYRDIASLYKSMYRYKDALIWVKKVFKYEKNDAVSNFIMGYLSNKLEKNDKAYIYYERAIKSSKTYMLAYIHYGEFYFSRKRYNEAEKIWLEGNKKRYSNTIAQRLGALYFKTKKYDKAIEQYNKMLEKFPKNLEPYFNIGKVYEARNNEKKAIEYYYKAISKNRIYDSPKIALANIYIKNKKLNKALEIYKELNETHISKTTFYLYKQAEILKIQKKDKELKIIIKKLKNSKLKQSADYLKLLESN